MITSPLGLAEVPHVAAPAGKAELARAARRCEFPEITELPIWLIPGVRCGPKAVTLKSIATVDVMRGEETLCLGLAALGLIQPPATVLNVGSHWKAIRLDARARIHSSLTSLSGELIHATQTETILASAVPCERPASIEPEWCQAGLEEQRRSGLARSLFCVRLLELNRVGAPEQRLSFLIGAYVGADLAAMIRQAVFAPGESVRITGSGAVAEGWRRALTKSSIHAAVTSETDLEAALLAGLRVVTEAMTL
jgi:2-dehydro-3-deoxygalactonokinase